MSAERITQTLFGLAVVVCPAIVAGLSFLSFVK